MAAGPLLHASQGYHVRSLILLLSVWKGGVRWGPQSKPRAQWGWRREGRHPASQHGPHESRPKQLLHQLQRWLGSPHLQQARPHHFSCRESPVSSNQTHCLLPLVYHCCISPAAPGIFSHPLHLNDVTEFSWTPATARVVYFYISPERQEFAHIMYT